MKSISEIEDELIEDFSIFEDERMQRYEYLIELGEKLPPYPEAFKTEDFLVKGCQTKVWLRGIYTDGRMYYLADANTQIVKGIVSLFVKIFSGQQPKDILQADLKFVDALNLKQHLVSQRSNGLTAMIQRMKAYASAFA